MKIDSENILLEDYIVIVIDKPALLPTQSSANSNKKNLYSLLQDHLSEREKKEIYLGLHHRLDAATSGAILFCKNRSYNKDFALMFRNKLIKKTYLAIVDILDETSLQKEWTISNNLKTYKFKHFKKAKSANKGDKAVSHFKLLKKKGSLALIECIPETGRLHQIRVHLSEYGLPVVGDFHYNKNRSHQRLMLHAKSLEFIHPKTKKKINVTSPTPKEFSDFFN